MVGVGTSHSGNEGFQTPGFLTKTGLFPARSPAPITLVCGVRSSGVPPKAFKIPPNPLRTHCSMTPETHIRFARNQPHCPIIWLRPPTPRLRRLRHARGNLRPAPARLRCKSCQTAMADTGHSSSFAECRRKPRRPRPTGRRFECTYSGCGRVYSRAEHLERHKLNRKRPPQLFVISFFVGVSALFQTLYDIATRTGRTLDSLR